MHGDRAISRAIRSSLPVLFLLFSILPTSLAGQATRPLAVVLPTDSGATIPVVAHRGYPAIQAEALLPLGWGSRPPATDGLVTLRHRTGIDLRFTPGSPFFAWDGELLQLAHPPYWFGESFHLPLQLVVDLFPGLLPRAYRFDPERFVLEVEGGIAERPDGPREAWEPEASAPSVIAPDRGPSRIVVIDPGHGGDDPGAIGPGGAREKDVALAIGNALARELSEDHELEVRFTRDRDQLVPLWSRGEWATEWKGDRPGVFISIHANALPDRPGVRGFETYFLSEARDEHERRVAALENAATAGGVTQSPVAGADPFLGAILQDLRTFDHQHWSADLAEEVQRELGRVHPGPDRGVKQGPFAVITNSLMPSVLVEVGFLTNAEEERLLTRPEFHQASAEAIARAIRAFFDRYPPGR
ncbi:MAG: N-acetylmuramoyl-L-alanine amidase [Gemmatimonadota bacterium]